MKNVLSIIIFVFAVLVSAGSGQDDCCHPDVLFIIEHTCKDLPDFDFYYRPFMIDTVNYYGDCEATRGASIEFAKEVKVAFRFDDQTSLSALTEFLADYDFGPALGSGNNIHLAIETALEDVLQSAHNNPYSSPTQVVIITHSNPSDLEKTYRNVESLKKVATVYVLALGQNYDADQLRNLASNSSLLMQVTSTSMLLGLCDSGYCDLLKMKCEIRPQPEPEPETTTKLSPPPTTTMPEPTTLPSTTSTTTTARPTTTRTALPSPPSTPANEFCHRCRNRRNSKDHYGDPSDCHYFYQCLFLNESYAIGVRRPCAPGTFWRDEVLSCLLEGDTPCQDVCRNDDVATGGCYGAPDSCSRYFVCSNGASYQFCCPLRTRFDATTCNCIGDGNCTDVCSLTGPAQKQTKLPATKLSDTECVDEYGNTFRSFVDRRNYFQLVGDVRQQECAPGTLFDVDRCRCDFLTTFTATSENKKCNLWLPFDNDTNDHSAYKYLTYLYGEGNIDQQTVGRGRGSFRFSAGRIEIPGFKTFDFQKQASFCLFFNGLNGGLLSNNNDSMLVDYSVILATQSGSVSGMLRFWHPIGTRTVFSQVTSGWNQVCLTYNGESIALYLNGNLAESKQARGRISIGHCPYTLGTDQYFGDFNGHIDDVLVCPFAFNQADVNQYYAGNRTYLVEQGYIPADN